MVYFHIRIFIQRIRILSFLSTQHVPIIATHINDKALVMILKKLKCFKNVNIYGLFYFERCSLITATGVQTNYHNVLTLEQSIA